MISPIRPLTVSRLAALAFTMSFTALLYNPSPTLATTSAPSLGSASGFAALAGTAVTCTNSPLTGNVGVWPGTAVTQTGCTVAGTVHAGDGVAKQAYLDFVSAYNSLAPLNNTCDSTHKLTGTLNGQSLSPGVYCVDAVAKGGTLALNAGNNPNAFWIFLVNGALTGTNFNVVMLNGGQPCNVYWWVKDAATLTDSNLLGTVLSGAAITVTGGTFGGDALATAAVTLTGARVTACQATGGTGGGNGRGKCNQADDNEHDKCNQGDDSGHDKHNQGDDNGHDKRNHGDDNEHDKGNQGDDNEHGK
jgi:hypothetical protein